jgi:hypothetical protein
MDILVGNEVKKNWLTAMFVAVWLEDRRTGWQKNMSKLADRRTVFLGEKWTGRLTEK